MNIQDDSINSVDQLADLIKAAETLGVESVRRQDKKDDVYVWIQNVLIRLQYLRLSKKHKGVVRRYLNLYSGYSESHIDHLISKHRVSGKIVRVLRTQPIFPTKYNRGDIALLAEVAEAFNHQNGKALKEVCRDMYEVYGDERFLRLKNISVSRLYDLKKTPTYQNIIRTYTKTRPTSVQIGERKKPRPDGKPGYIRVDSVHQGDLDGEKGVYHINLVDEVTQWEVVTTVAGISEEFLLPALESAITSFPFNILNFHSDNGSEYINRTVAKLLAKLHINQTKSRARRTNDQALVESKNGAVVRPVYGRIHIPRHKAPTIDVFNQRYLNLFLNFHRKCAFPDEEIDERGKIVKKYRTFVTPCEKLLLIKNVSVYLVEGVTTYTLQAESKRQSHLVAAQEMQKEKSKLFKKLI